MARSPALKVYRLPIGFHDAYVAAPSQKAAIEAWGSDKDVFQRKQAELVEDPELTREPLAEPGKVVKKLRGTAAEQIAALGETETEPPNRKGGSGAKMKAQKPKAAPKPKPKPSRAALDEAEAALAEAEARQKAALREIEKREAELARERRALEREQGRERERLEAARERAASAYQEAVRRWRG